MEIKAETRGVFWIGGKLRICANAYIRSKEIMPIARYTERHFVTMTGINIMDTLFNSLFGLSGLPLVGFATNKKDIWSYEDYYCQLLLNFSMKII